MLKIDRPAFEFVADFIEFKRLAKLLSSLIAAIDSLNQL
jgi:hypothetical protein